jgi:hypothetical protein
MTSSKEGSPYSHHFAEFIEHCLPKLNYEDGTKLITKKFNFVMTQAITSSALSVQVTGGFPSNEPAMYSNMTRYRNLHEMFEPPDENILDQVIASQNHFCYMWAMWYISLRLHGKNIEDVLPEFDKSGVLSAELSNKSTVTEMKKYTKHATEWHNLFLPLVVIKKFIFCLMNKRGPVRDAFQTFIGCDKDKPCYAFEFFKAHFMSVWHNEISPTSSKFERYKIQFNLDANHDCFVNSTPMDNGLIFNTKLVREKTPL